MRLRLAGRLRPSTNCFVGVARLLHDDLPEGIFVTRHQSYLAVLLAVAVGRRAHSSG